jgi:sister-chromatid-cohesion protein PDS5
LQDVTAAARKLSMNVIKQCIGTLEPSIKHFFLSLVSGESKPVNSQVQYHEVLYDICCCAPQILSGILPYVTGELQVITDSFVFLMLPVVSEE